MFVKIRSYREGGNGVGEPPRTIPHRDWIYESQKVELCKRRIKGLDEYHNFINPFFPPHTGVLEGPSSINVINGDLVEANMDVELVEIKLDEFTIVAVDCHVYVMNNSGKTIDHVICN